MADKLLNPQQLDPNQVKVGLSTVRNHEKRLKAIEDHINGISSDLGGGDKTADVVGTTKQVKDMTKAQLIEFAKTKDIQLDPQSKREQMLEDLKDYL